MLIDVPVGDKMKEPAANRVYSQCPPRSSLDSEDRNWHGVDFVASQDPRNWRAQIDAEGSVVTVGFFKTKLEAGLAVNRFCQEQCLPLQIPSLQKEDIQEKILLKAEEPSSKETEKNISDPTEKKKERRPSAKSGYFGVYEVRRGSPFDSKSSYVSRVCMNGKQYYLGTFDSKFEAANCVNYFCIANGLPVKNIDVLKQSELPTHTTDNIHDGLWSPNTPLCAYDTHLEDGKQLESQKQSSIHQKLLSYESDPNYIPERSTKSRTKRKGRKRRREGFDMEKELVAKQKKTKDRSKCKSSVYIGVLKRYDNWKAQLSYNGGQKYLGTFKTEKEAGIAVNNFCLRNGIKAKNPSLIPSTGPSLIPDPTRLQRGHHRRNKKRESPVLGSVFGNLSQNKNQRKHSRKLRMVKKKGRNRKWKKQENSIVSQLDNDQDLPYISKSDFLLNSPATLPPSLSFTNFEAEKENQRMSHMRNANHALMPEEDLKVELTFKRKHNTRGNKLSQNLNPRRDRVLEERYCSKSGKKWWLTEFKGVQQWMLFDHLKNKNLFLEFCLEQMNYMAFDGSWVGKEIMVRSEGTWAKATITNKLDERRFSVCYTNGTGAVLDLKSRNVIFFPLKETTKIDIDGFWLLPMDLNREQRMVQVVGDRLIWESNSSFGLTFLSQMESKLIIGPGRRLSFRLGDKLYSGRIVNVNCILWNGDEFWHRLVEENTPPITSIKFIPNVEHYWGVMVNPRTFEICHIMEHSQFQKLGVKVLWKIIEVNDIPVIESNKPVIYDFLCKGFACTIKFETKPSRQSYLEKTPVFFSPTLRSYSNKQFLPRSVRMLSPPKNSSSSSPQPKLFFQSSELPLKFKQNSSSASSTTSSFCEFQNPDSPNTFNHVTLSPSSPLQMLLPTPEKSSKNNTSPNLLLSLKNEESREQTITNHKICSPNPPSIFSSSSASPSENENGNSPMTKISDAASADNSPAPSRLNISWSSLPPQLEKSCKIEEEEEENFVKSHDNADPHEKSEICLKVKKEEKEV